MDTQFLTNPDVVKARHTGHAILFATGAPHHILTEYTRRMASFTLVAGAASLLKSRAGGFEVCSGRYRKEEDGRAYEGDGYEFHFLEVVRTVQLD